jgi:hypothetical protein
MTRNAFSSLLAIPALSLLTGLSAAGSLTNGPASAAAEPEPAQGEPPIHPAPYEAPPVLRAADLLPAEALSGPHHRVADAVPSDGFLTRFTIESDFGAFEATSPALALTRIREIAALAELAKFETEDLAKDGFGHSAERLRGSFQHLAEDPEGTLKGIPDGVGRFFKRVGRAAKTGYQTVQDRRAAPDEPTAVLPGPGSRLPGGPLTGSETASEQPTGAEVAAKLAGRTTADIFGYSEQRREIAKRLDVDPYTDNAVLAERLDEVAWAAFSGGLGVTALKALVPAGNLVTVTSSASNWVWETSPGDLRVYNEQTLLGLGAPQEDVDRLLRHPFFTTSLRTRLARALDAMPKVADRAVVMPLALSVTSSGQARFVVESAEMLAQIHTAERRLDRLVLDGTLFARSGESLVVPAPVDAMSWNAQLHGFAQRVAGQSGERRMYVRGGVSPLAREQLAALGWTLAAWPAPAPAGPR